MILLAYFVDISRVRRRLKLTLETGTLGSLHRSDYVIKPISFCCVQNLRIKTPKCCATSKIRHEIYLLRDHNCQYMFYMNLLYFVTIYILTSMSSNAWMAPDFHGTPATTKKHKSIWRLKRQGRVETI